MNIGVLPCKRDKHTAEISKMASVDYDSYLPSCGTEMIQFCADFCVRCACPEEILWNEKQEGNGCKFILEATAENKRPEPWVVKDGEAFCLNFREL